MENNHLKMQKLACIENTRTLFFWLIFLCLGVGSVTAFEPEIHEAITEEVLMARGFDVATAGMVSDANRDTEWLESLSLAAHAYGNRLSAVSQRLVQKRDLIRNALLSCDRRTAIEALGQGLHTVQDLYAHSNAVDNKILIPDLLAMADGTASCRPPQMAPDGLVSSYFSVTGFQDGDECSGKPATMCCHRDLNKDSTDQPNGDLHQAALLAARDATHVYYGLVEADLLNQSEGERLLALLQKKQRTVVFAIDDTGSMWNDIAGVKAAVNKFLDQFAANDHEAPALGLVTYKDEVQDHGMICDIETLRGEINGLVAKGGGDCPEVSSSATIAALEHIPTSSSELHKLGGEVLLATDASARDREMGPLVVAKARARRVAISPILTGDCVSENAEPNGKASVGSHFAVTGSLSDDPLVSPSAAAQLRAIAEETGGIFFHARRSEVEDLAATLLEISAPEVDLLQRQQINLAGVWESMIPVSSSSERINILVEASDPSVVTEVLLVRPSSVPVAEGDSDVTIHRLSSVTSYGVSFPEPGFWRVQVVGQGDISFHFFSRTAERLDSVRFFEMSALSSSGWAPIEGQPAVGDRLRAELRFTYQPKEIQVALHAADGTLLESLTPAAGIGERRYHVDLRVPDQSFMLKMTGLTATDQPFVHQTSPMTPGQVRLGIWPKAGIVNPQTAATFELSVTSNAAELASYRLTVSPEKPWSVTCPSAVNVPPGGTISIPVEVTAPLGAAEGEGNEITFLVESTVNPRIRNSATLLLTAGLSNRPPICDNAVVFPGSLWPPNHKLVKVQIGGVTDPDRNLLTVRALTITQDEPVRSRADRTAPDGFVDASTVALRAERNGKGDGRVYSVTFTAVDSLGASCIGSVQVGVPHDRAGVAVDSGQRYDSTGTPST